MSKLIKDTTKSFGHAFAGIKVLVKERNAKIEIAWWVMLLLIDLLTARGIGFAIFISLMMLMMLAVESLNTAVEKTVDAFGERNEILKNAKDVAATGTMFVSFVVFVVSVILIINMIGIAI